MSLNVERVLYGITLITLVISLWFSLRWALSPVKPSSSPNPPSLQTQPTPPTGNTPEAPGRKVEGPAQILETVKSTDVSIVRLMLIGIALQAIGFGLVWSQVRQLNRGIQGETHSKLYDHYLKITERLAGETKLRPYFYNREKELKTDAAGYADLRGEIDMMCEIILGLLEHAAVQKKNLPKDSWTACWEAYTNERLDKSIELRKFFRENHLWYAKSFRAVVAAKYPHLTKDCGCAPREAAIQRDCAPSGSKAQAAEVNTA